MASYRAKNELIAHEIFREISEQGLDPVLRDYDFFYKERYSGDRLKYRLIVPITVKNVYPSAQQLEVILKGEEKTISINCIFARLRKRPKKGLIQRGVNAFVKAIAKPADPSPTAYAEGGAKAMRKPGAVHDSPGIHQGRSGGHGRDREGSGGVQEYGRGRGFGWQEPSRIYAEQPSSKHLDA
eukprot:m.37227 g.37227  ORF g.37227 m.37227 type:complete len:183 (-) comp12486_c0_seq1:107-655(-)